jgi:endonuclease/exonuclease/phosphatase (EEP) superfamily protein YafD
MVRVQQLDFYTGAASRVHCTFIFELYVHTHVGSRAPKPWDRITKVDMVLLARQEFHTSNVHKTNNFLKLEKQENEQKELLWKHADVAKTDEYEMTIMMIMQ